MWLALLLIAPIESTWSQEEDVHTPADRARGIDLQRMKVAVGSRPGEPVTQDRALEIRTTVDPATGRPVLSADVVARHATDYEQPAVVLQPAVEPSPGAGRERVYEMPTVALQHVSLTAAEEAVAVQSIASLIKSDVGQLTVLPGVLRAEGVQGIVNLKPYILAGRPLQFNEDRGEFVGSIHVGVADPFSTAGGSALTDPIVFQIMETEVAEPDTVTVAHTSPPHTEVVIRAQNAPDPFEIRVASRFAPDGVPVRLKLAPRLRLSVPEVIEGMGLGSAIVTVWVEGMTQQVEGRIVVLEVKPSGALSSTRVTLDSTGHGVEKLRSDWLGSARVTASSPGLSPVEKEVRYSLPWPTLAATFLGAVLGGLAHWVALKGRKPAIWRAVFSAFIAGTLVFGLWALGVNLLTVQIPAGSAQVGSFCVAALGGWFGLNRLVPKGAPG